MTPKLFTRRGLVRQFLNKLVRTLTPTILQFTNVNFQRRTSQHDTQAVHTKGISKIVTSQQINKVIDPYQITL